MIRAIVFISCLAGMFLNSKFFAFGRDYGMVVFLRLVITVLEPQDLAQDQEQNVSFYTISARLQKVCDEGWPTSVLGHASNKLIILVTHKKSQIIAQSSLKASISTFVM